MHKPKPERNRRMGISIRGHAGSTTRDVSGPSAVVYPDHRNSLFTANAESASHQQGSRPFLVGTSSPPQGIHICAAATQQAPPWPAVHPDRLNMIDTERRILSPRINPDRMAMILEYQRENDVGVNVSNNKGNEGGEVDLFHFGQGEQSWRPFGEKMTRVNLAPSFTRISPPPYQSYSTTLPTLFEMSATPRDRDARSLQNGVNGTGPHPSFIQVANPYIFEQKIQDCLTALESSEAKEDNIRLQGVLWIDSVRKALQLPVRTFNTAVIYYHKFRLVHSDNEYMFLDAAAAALFTACKIEDTLKKSREILCAAYNLKVSLSEHLSPDDQVFEAPSKTIVGLERLMLESAGFDFRNRHPQRIVIKLIREWGVDTSTIGKTAYNMCIDIYRTFAPLKQTASTLAFACVELATRIHDAALTPDMTDSESYKKWSITREEVLETILDLLDLYTHHPKATTVGMEHPIDSFINTRITLNKEASAAGYPRYTVWETAPKHSNGGASTATNGHALPDVSPASDPKTGVPSPSPPAMGPTSATGARSRVGERSKDGMVRFMLHAQKARDEKETVAQYFAPDEWEEYEEEIEVPVEQLSRR